MTASVSSHNNIFIGIDVGGASFEAAWHRGGCTQYENRPDAIAAFVARLSVEKQIIRIAVEPTGGYEGVLIPDHTPSVECAAPWHAGMAFALGYMRASIRLIEEGSWRDTPSLYRRHGLFVAASAAQAHEQLACGARVVGPIGGGGAAPDAARIRDEIETARSRGPCGVTEIRDTLRGLFREHATPVRLAELARLAGLPVTVTGSRQIAVLAMPRDQAEVTRLASAVLRQQHRPSEVVVTLPPESSAERPAGESPAGTRKEGKDGAALTERGVSAAFAEVSASGIAVRTVRAEGPGKAARAARAVRSPWAAPWDTTRDYPDTHLLDLACARECSRADAVGYSPGDGYVFSTKIEPALARPGLLAATATDGGAGSAAFSSDAWARRGLALFAIPG